MNEIENRARLEALGKTAEELVGLVSPVARVSGVRVVAALNELERRAVLLPKVQEALRDAENVAYDKLEADARKEQGAAKSPPSGAIDMDAEFRIAEAAKLREQGRRMGRRDWRKCRRDVRAVRREVQAQWGNAWGGGDALSGGFFAEIWESCLAYASGAGADDMAAWVAVARLAGAKEDACLCVENGGIFQRVGTGRGALVSGYQLLSPVSGDEGRRLIREQTESMRRVIQGGAS